MKVPQKYTCQEDIFKILSMSYTNKEDAVKRVEEYMTRRDILNKFTIHQGGGVDQRYYAYLDGKKTKKFTNQKKLEDYLVNLYNDKSLKEATLEDILKDFLSDRRLKRADGTYKKDIYAINVYIKTSSIYQKRICDINYEDGGLFFEHCKNIYMDINKEEMTEKYFTQTFGVLKAMLNYAISAKKIISKSPFENFEVHKDKFRPKKSKRDTDVIYEDAEKDALKKCAFAFAEATKKAKYLVPIIFFNLGIRDGELMAMRWKHLNLAEKTLYVDYEFIEKSDDNGKHIGYKLVEHAKTVAGTRTIHLNSECVKTFKLIKQYNLECGYGVSDEDFVFLREYKNEITHLTPRTVYTAISKECKAIGMLKIKSPHDMRRTCFTNLYYAGMPLKDIQAFAGHEDIRMTEAYIKKKHSDQENEYLELII